jgi:cytochrome c-type biogenesis protein
MDETSALLAAFGAGFCSLVSPGIVPLLPGFAGFLHGRPFGHLLAFLAAFSLGFVALGATASAPGRFLLEHLPVVEGAAAVFLIALGLRGMGFRGLTRHRSSNLAAEPAGAAGVAVALLAGGALVFGWTPIAGVVLAQILAIATSPDRLAAGVTLLSAYALGRALSMLALGLALSAALRALARSRHARHVAVIGGALVAFAGVLIVTNTFPIAAAALADHLPLF